LTFEQELRLEIYELLELDAEGLIVPFKNLVCEIACCAVCELNSPLIIVQARRRLEYPSGGEQEMESVWSSE
jgi:hypothetical protein